MRRPDLSGCAALVTGGARGLGAGVAAALAEAGAAVVVADVREDLGRATADALKQTGAIATFVRLDVTDDASWERAVGETIGELGGLDVVVNNAGVWISGLLADLDPAEVRRMLDVNVLGTALGIKHAFRAMRPGGPAGNGGAVVNIASAAATVALPGIAGYSATKSAVDRLTRVAATEAGKLGYDVRVNCVYPGLEPTAQGTRLTTDAVVFLASDAARFVTGAGLPVEGGLDT
ncbi:SDR family oxidoreductase [Amycolatopsis sp. NPDC048633]|uniref:SDR family NAD(P)-dependent oxidoreductase n=1 Tax=Amycolatopsis sp. NPDC048633 TaxID=3157095 RepID=UPI0033D1938B